LLSCQMFQGLWYECLYFYGLNLLNFPNLQDAFGFQSIANDSLLFLNNEWDTPEDFWGSAGPILPSEEWKNLIGKGTIVHLSAYEGYNGQGANLDELVAAGEILELTVKEVTDLENFDITQSEFQTQYLNDEALLQSDFKTAFVTRRNLRISLNVYDNLESVLGVGIDIEENPEAAIAHWDTFNLKLKALLKQFD